MAKPFWREGSARFLKKSGVGGTNFLFRILLFLYVTVREVSLVKSMDQGRPGWIHGRGKLCIDHSIGLTPLVTRLQGYDIIHGEPIVDPTVQEPRIFNDF